jgi:hypothetical protein
MSDSKLPDMQAGWEQGILNVMAGLSGLNMVYESVGMHASLLGFCLESLVLGDDLLGQVQRCVRGIDVTEDSVSPEWHLICQDPQTSGGLLMAVRPGLAGLVQQQLGTQGVPAAIIGTVTGPLTEGAPLVRLV